MYKLIETHHLFILKYAYVLFTYHWHNRIYGRTLLNIPYFVMGPLSFATQPNVQFKHLDKQMAYSETIPTC